MIKTDFTKDLMNFIDSGVTAFQATEESKKILNENGFIELELNKPWNLKSLDDSEGKYYVVKNLSSIVAFTINSKNIEEEGFRIVGSHSDAPTFRIKPNAEVSAEKDSYLKLNIEAYGGAIYSTWYDRPLSIAGRVTLKGENILHPVEKLVDFKKPMCIIPNLAIHMNRAVNEGTKINVQEDMYPLVGLLGENLEKENYLIKKIAKELNVNQDEILDFDLFLYDVQKASLVGENDEFLSVGRQDNLSMAYASLRGIINADAKSGVNIASVFDNEEVGSQTKQGADSNMLLNIMEKISLSLGKTREEFLNAIYSSFVISADLAHAAHPNRPGKCDPTTRPVMGKGPAIKESANQAYTSDSVSIGIYKSICEKAGVSYQSFVNRSDEKGGSTIGPKSASHIDINSVDIGCPILAMHSVRELGAVSDYIDTYKTFVAFFEI
ncbi:MAG: M18 family aminopeptidase [Clostridioides sp.]|jgi:aspartyl aminopeptidase|nr:M18 family aminopeptidase [Clostridioides sp.]